MQGKNFEGKFSRQKWGSIKTRSVFVSSPMPGKVQKQDFVNNQALTKRTLIFTPFRKTQNSDRFQTKSGENGLISESECVSCTLAEML